MLRVFVITLALAGCSKEKRIRGDFELICYSFERSGAVHEKDPSHKAMIIAKYVSDHLKSDEVKELMRGMTMLSPEEKQKAFKKAMAESGYAGPCPFFDQK